MKRSITPVVVSALVAAACGGGDNADGRPTSEPSGTSGSAVPATSTADAPPAPADVDTNPEIASEQVTTTISEPVPVPEPVDFSKEPFVMFAPVPPRPDGAPSSLPDGLDDFHDLFDDDAPWASARDTIDGFKIHSWMIRHYLTDDELIRIADFLERHDIALMIEAEPLDPPDPTECDHGESFEGPYEIENAERLHELGITPAAYAIEQPFSYGHRLDTPGACQYELDRVLDEVVAWAGDLRAVFPDVAIGSIEALWDRPTTTPDDFGIWIDAYTEAMGEPPAFQHVDVNWAIPDWPATLLGIEEVVESRGVPFGPLYNGFTEPSNDEWVVRAIEHMSIYEIDHGGTPGHVSIQSWYPQPDQALPETELSAMTHLINRYIGARPTFEAAVTEGALSGRVVDQAGNPIGQLPVDVLTAPGPGTRQQFTLTGEVPAGSSEALLMVRVNFEDSFDIASDASIHSIEYSEEPDSGVGIVPNGSFAGSLDAWGVYDDNEGDVRWVSDDGDGAMKVSAERSARVLVDGPVFPVTSGAIYTVVIDVSVTDATSHGAIGLGFLSDGTETQRVVLEMVADERSLGTGSTAGDGTFSIPVAPDLLAAAAEGSVIRVATPGDLTTWPASIEVD